MTRAPSRGTSGTPSSRWRGRSACPPRAPSPALRRPTGTSRRVCARAAAGTARLRARGGWSWLLDGIQQLGRERAHLEILGFELLDLEAVEAGVGEEVAAQLPVLLLDDPRQELIDVERLEADLGDDFLEQRVGDLVLQLGHLRIVRHLRLDLAPERLAPLGRVQLEVEVRHPPPRQPVHRHVSALGAVDRRDRLRDVGERGLVVLDRDEAERQRVELLLPVRQRVVVRHDRIDEERLKEAALQAFEDLHVADERAHLLEGELDVVHEGEAVDERGGVVDAVEEGDQLAEGLEALVVLFLAADLVDQLAGLEQQFLEGLVAVRRGALLVVHELDHVERRELAADVLAEEKAAEDLARGGDVAGLLLVFAAADVVLLQDDLFEGVEDRERHFVAQREGAQAHQPRARRGADGGAGAAGEDALVLVDELLVVGMVIDDVDLDALALVGIDAAAGARVVHRLLLGVGVAAEVVEARVVTLDDADEDEGRRRLAEVVEDLVREPEELPGADAPRTLEELADGAHGVLLPVFDVGEALAVVDEEEVVGDGVALQEEVVEGLEALGIRGEAELVRARIGRGAVHDEAVDDFVVEEIADRQVPAEHVLAEDATVAAEPHALGVENDLRRAAEIAHDVAARRVDLLEEEAAIDVGPGDGREVFDRGADEALVDDRADHALGCAFRYTFINSQSFRCVYFCVVDSDAWPSSS